MTRFSPGRCATVLGVLVFLLAGVPAHAQDLEVYPLRPPDTSSPRATFKSFISNLNLAIQTYKNDEQFSSRSQWNDAVAGYMDKVLRTMDLSGIAPSLRRQRGVEAATLLKEIFDRVEIPDYADIPGPDEAESEPVAQGGEAADDPRSVQPTVDDAQGTQAKDLNAESEPEPPAAPVTKWTVPNTEITIAQVRDGPREGEFLFTKETVQDTRAFYNRAQHLPPKPDAVDSAYEILTTTAGYWFDPDWIAALPKALTVVINGNPLWRWVALVATVAVLGFVVLRVLRWGYHWDAGHKVNGREQRLGRILAAIIAFALLVFVEYFLRRQVSLVGDALLFVSPVLLVTQTAIILWGLWLLMDQVAQTVIGLRGLRYRSVDAHMVRATFRILSFVGAVLVIVWLTERLGIPLTPVLAGLGVGGLAVALAARPTLENIIGGMILFADRPVRVGDFFRWGNQVGTVEEIGLRSTRIRTLDRTLVTIPNADFSAMQLENFEARDMILWMTKLSLHRETTSDQLQFVLAKMREMLIAHPMVSPDPARVRLIGVGDHGIDLDVFVYIKTSDINVWHAVIEDILVRILKILEDAGTGFALPIEVRPPPGYGFDADRSRSAEVEVQEWRQKGKFPFPEFAEEDRKRVAGTLAFPPEGSPDYKPAPQPPSRLKVVSADSNSDSADRP